MSARFPIHILGSVLLGSTLTACTRASTAQTPANAITQIARLGPEMVCPSQDFMTFLKAFVDSVGVQHRFVRDPYAVTSYDPQNLEADPATVYLKASEITFPVMPGQNEMTSQGIRMKAERTAPDAWRVSTWQQGTDAFSRSFDFRKSSGCWFLTHSTE